MNELSGRRGVAAAVAYLALVTAFIYVVPESGGVVGWVVVVGLLTLHVATGYVVGRVWAVLLPLAAVVIAVPAADPEDAEIPLWFGLLFSVPFAMALIAAGILATLATDHAAGKRRERRSPNAPR